MKEIQLPNNVLDVLDEYETIKKKLTSIINYETIGAFLDKELGDTKKYDISSQSFYLIEINNYEIYIYHNKLIMSSDIALFIKITKRIHNTIYPNYIIRKYISYKNLKEFINDLNNDMKLAKQGEL